MPQADPKSSPEQEQHQTAQTFPYSFLYPQQSEDDTIDLYELWITLWNRKWLVIVVTVVFALGSIVYVLQLQHIYLAEALLLPPTEKDVSSISVTGISRNISKRTELNIGLNLPNDVFKRFKQNLNSRTIQRKFIQENGLMELLAPNRTAETRDEDIIKGFSGLIKLTEKSNASSLSIELHDAEIAAQWVNDLIKFVDKETVAQMVEDAQNSIATQIMEIEYTIASKRQMAKKRRQDQIIRYKEAAQIAENLGIKRQVGTTNLVQKNQMNVDIASATIPLYYLGYDALLTEISILRNRKSDDPFISDLRDLQERLALLRSLNFNKEKISAVSIDQAAYPPKYAIKPDRRLIASIGTVAGLFLGIFLVFLIEYVKKQREKHSD